MTRIEKTVLICNGYIQKMNPANGSFQENNGTIRFHFL